MSFSRSIKGYVVIDFLEGNDRFICRILYSCSSVCFFLFFHYRIIADIMSSEERSKWLARLDAVISCAYIIGQGIGGLLATKSCQLPLY